MAAHIMKPVVSISMSPDSCSSGESTTADLPLAGEPLGSNVDTSRGGSVAIAL